jgi:diacylglycerol kinase
MDYTHPDITIRIEHSSLLRKDSPLKKVFSSDPGLTAQIFLSLPVIVAGMIFHITVLQWVLVIFATLLFLFAGIFRTASLLQIKRDQSLNSFHGNRIRCMGNALVTITSGISFFIYMLVFVPSIIQML